MTGLLDFLNIIKTKITIQHEIDQPDSYGQSPLLRVCSSSSVGQPLTQKAYKEARELIEKGADIFANNKFKNNFPLRSLLVREETKIIEKLFEQWLQKNPEKKAHAWQELEKLSNDCLLLAQGQDRQIEEKLDSLKTILKDFNTNDNNEENNLSPSLNEETIPFLTNKNSNLHKRHV